MTEAQLFRQYSGFRIAYPQFERRAHTTRGARDCRGQFNRYLGPGSFLRVVRTCLSSAQVRSVENLPYSCAGNDNWHSLPIEERQHLMCDHGMLKRHYTREERLKTTYGNFAKLLRNAQANFTERMRIERG